MKKYLPLILKYSISFLIGVGLFFIVISIQNIYTLIDKKEIIHYLSDGFIVPGILFVGIGFIIMFSNMGAFYGMGYTLKHLFTMLLPFIKNREESYAEYLEKRKKINGYMFLFIVGGGFLLTGVIFLFIYLAS